MSSSGSRRLFLALFVAVGIVILALRGPNLKETITDIVIVLIVCFVVIAAWSGPSLSTKRNLSKQAPTALVINVFTDDSLRAYVSENLLWSHDLASQKLRRVTTMKVTSDGIEFWVGGGQPVRISQVPVSHIASLTAEVGPMGSLPPSNYLMMSTTDGEEVNVARLRWLNMRTLAASTIADFDANTHARMR